GRLLVEMALVRLARLEDLVPISQLAQWVGQARPDAAAAPPGARSVAPPEGLKKKLTPPAENGAVAGPLPLTAETLPQVWGQVLAGVGVMFANSLEKGGFPAISGPNTLVIRFPPAYNGDKDYCQEPTRLQRVEAALQKITGRPWTLRV